jgi:hypothetical protein
MIKINAFWRVLNQKVKTRYFLMDFQYGCFESFPFRQNFATKSEQNNGITMFNTSNEGTGGLGISYSSSSMFEFYGIFLATFNPCILKINAFWRVLNQKVKTRYFLMDFQYGCFESFSFRQKVAS